MEIVILIILSIIVLFIWVCFVVRNYEVFKFRGYIADLIYSKACDMIDEGASHNDIFGLWDMLDDISYDKMLFSFKPLKMEYWFTEEELKLLGYESNRLDKSGR